MGKIEVEYIQRDWGAGEQYIANGAAAGVGIACLMEWNETRPSFEDPGRYRISVRLNTVDGNLAETSAPVLVLEPDNPDQWLDRMGCAGAHVPIFKNSPPNGRHPTWQDLDLPLLIALPGSLTVGDWEKVLDAVRRGCTAIINP